MSQMSPKRGWRGRLEQAEAALSGQSLLRWAVGGLGVFGVLTTLVSGLLVKDYVDYLHRSNQGYALIETISVDASRLALDADGPPPAIVDALAQSLDAFSRAPQGTPWADSPEASAFLDAGRALYYRLSGRDVTVGETGDVTGMLALAIIQAGQDLKAAAAQSEIAILQAKGRQVGLTMAASGLLWATLFVVFLATGGQTIRPVTGDHSPPGTVLPAASGPGILGDGADSAAPSLSASRSSTPVFGTKVLIVEDNPINQKIAAAMLASQGMAFDMVEDGSKAVEQVQSGAYGIVLMDVQMPIMDGLEATRRIRALPGPISRIPIIAVTANALQGDRETYLKTGMDDFVPKPIDPSALISVVESHLNGQQPPSEQAPSEQALSA